jgi:hypothetical protein
MLLHYMISYYNNMFNYNNLQTFYYHYRTVCVSLAKTSLDRVFISICLSYPPLMSCVVSVDRKSDESSSISKYEVTATEPTPHGD